MRRRLLLMSLLPAVGKRVSCKRSEWPVSVQVKTVNVEQDASKTAGELQHAMYSLDQDGFEVVSVVPVIQFGDTSVILVCGVKRDRS